MRCSRSAVIEIADRAASTSPAATASSIASSDIAS
jgi:hypothetical protein